MGAQVMCAIGPSWTDFQERHRMRQILRDVVGKAVPTGEHCPRLKYPLGVPRTFVLTRYPNQCTRSTGTNAPGPSPALLRASLSGAFWLAPPSPICLGPWRFVSCINPPKIDMITYSQKKNHVLDEMALMTGNLCLLNEIDILYTCLGNYLVGRRSIVSGLAATDIQYRGCVTPCDSIWIARGLRLPLKVDVRDHYGASAYEDSHRISQILKTAEIGR